MTNFINFLLKFGDKTNIEALFTKGEIYMNTISSFKNLERKGIGDIYEGAVEVQNKGKGNITFQFPSKLMTFTYEEMQIRKHKEGHIGNIYSMYAISNLLFKRKKVHHFDSRMSIFGSHCLIIKDVPRFINLITSSLSQMGFEYSHDLVDYKNFKKKEAIELSLFHKSHTLSYQKEFRIIATTNEDKPLKFHIGSLEDFSEICTTEELIKTGSIEIIHLS